MAYFDALRFATQIKVKRGTRSLYQAIKDIGETGGDVSASTLLRLEQGKTPDVKAFIAICDWLSVEPSEFMVVPQRPAGPSDPTKRIEFILRCDRCITPEQINAVMVILCSLYGCAENDGGAQ